MDTPRTRDLHFPVINSTCEPLVNCRICSPCSAGCDGHCFPGAIVIESLDYFEQNNFFKILIVVEGRSHLKRERWAGCLQVILQHHPQNINKPSAVPYISLVHPFDKCHGNSMAWFVLHPSQIFLKVSPNWAFSETRNQTCSLFPTK